MKSIQYKYCSLLSGFVMLANLISIEAVFAKSRYKPFLLLHKSKAAELVISYPQKKVLHARHANAVRHPASLTKVMTLYLVFQALDKGQLYLDQKLPVSRHAATRAPTKLWLRQNQTITVRQAIYALVTKSANDAASVVAEAISGTEAKFAKLMTAKAKQLGMTKTVFYNASGLPHPKQVTTAHDMALLGYALIHDYPKYYSYFKTPFFKFRGRQYHTHNHLLEHYDGTDGIKTGYVHASGYNLLLSVIRKNKRLIAVVMGGVTAKRRDRRMMDMLDTAYHRVGVLE